MDDRVVDAKELRDTIVGEGLIFHPAKIPESAVNRRKTKFSSNPQFKALNWDVYNSEGVKNGSLKAKWTALLAGLTLLLSAHSGFGQLHVDSLYCQLQTRLEVGATLNSKKQHEAASDTLRALLPTIPIHKGLEFRRLLAEFHFQIGYAAYYEGDTALAQSSLYTADSMLETIDRQGSELRARILRQRGMVAYFMAEDGFAAKELYESAYREWLLIPEKDSVELAIVLQCMGQAATRLGEYSSAIDLYQQSLSMRERIFGKLHPRVGFAYWNLGNAYAYSDEYENAAQAYQEALEIMRISAPEDQLTIADIIRNLAATYGELGRYHEAIAYHLEAITIQKQLNGPFALSLVDYLSSLALDYSYDGQFALAESALKEMERIYQHHGIKNGERIASFRFIQAMVLDNSGARQQLVLQEFEASIGAISTVNAKVLDWTFYPECNSTKHPLLMQQIILGKSRYLGKTARKNGLKLPLLRASLKGYERAAELTNRLRLEYQDQDDKLFLSGRGSTFLQDALSIAFVLWDRTGESLHVSTAFKLMENCKFQLLLEFFRRSKVEISDEISKSTVERLDAFRQRCAELDYSLSNESLIKDSIEQYKAELLEKRLLMHALEDSLSTQSQIFKTANPDQTTVPLDSFRNQLPDHAAAVSYALSDSSIFVILATKKDINFRQTALAKGFIDSLEQWIGLCRKPLEKEEEVIEFARLGHSIYKVLLAPEMALLDHYTQLLIIPDGVLGNLPFEALLTQSPKPTARNLSKFPFLMRDFRCSYAASATLWMDQQKDLLSTKPLECLGLGWGKRTTSSLPGIPQPLNGIAGTETELKMLEKIVAGEYFLADAASEANFKSNAPRYGILHLALHARASESDPQILFPSQGDDKEDGVLHFHELFQLKLKARLAVLSACETGRGKLIQGEGIQSISSGFAAIGVPSVLMSLWEVDDNSGQQLMEGFYHGVQSGLSLDHALQQAKLDFLSQTTGDKGAPFYWAAFVPMGNMKPIDLATPYHSNTWLFGLLALVSVCIFIAYCIYNKKRKST